MCLKEKPKQAHKFCAWFYPCSIIDGMGARFLCPGCWMRRYEDMQNVITSCAMENSNSASGSRAAPHPTAVAYLGPKLHEKV